MGIRFKVLTDLMLEAHERLIKERNLPVYWLIEYRTERPLLHLQSWVIMAIT